MICTRCGRPVVEATDHAVRCPIVHEHRIADEEEMGWRRHLREHRESARDRLDYFLALLERQIGPPDPELIAEVEAMFGRIDHIRERELHNPVCSAAGWPCPIHCEEWPRGK